MSNNRTVAQFFGEIETTMKNRFRGWERNIPHEGEKGGIRERRVADFLSSILPKRYGIGTGHIIGHEKDMPGLTVSNQCDIVIFDRHNGIALPVDEYYSLFPCECVFAVIEIKSKFAASDGDGGPAGTIYQCVERTTRLKQFDRERHGLNEIHSIAFAYTTTWSTTPADQTKYWFECLGQKYSLRVPEVVFVLDPGFMFTAAGPTGYNLDGKLPVCYPKHSLLRFASDLVHRLSETRTMAPNLWSEYVPWQKGEVMALVDKES